MSALENSARRLLNEGLWVLGVLFKLAYLALWSAVLLCAVVAAVSGEGEMFVFFAVALASLSVGMRWYVLYQRELRALEASGPVSVPEMPPAHSLDARLVEILAAVKRNRPSKLFALGLVFLGALLSRCAGM